MYDTFVTICGNLLNAPEWRRTAKTGTLVAYFRIASTARRFDRASGQWVDGNSLRVRVTCWRKLAEGVAASLMSGDPVVVFGRLYTRDWVDSEGQHRTLYELEAATVGPDLSRGRARFARNRPSAALSTVEDAESDTIIAGEVTMPVPDREAPARREEAIFDDEVGLGGPPALPAGGYDPLADLRTGFSPANGAGGEEPDEPDEPDDLVELATDAPTGDEPPPIESLPIEPLSPERLTPGPLGHEPLSHESEPAGVAMAVPPGRSRRSRARAAVGV